MKNRCQISFRGAPAFSEDHAPAPEFVAAAPAKIPLIKPRLLARVGENVKIGSPLFEDKEDTDIKFLSPGGGAIIDILHGERRVIEAIIIELEKDEPFATFDPIDNQALSSMDRKQLIDALMVRGMWPMVRDITYRGIARKDDSPAAVWVSLDPAGPFAAASEVYLQGVEKRFAFGIRVLEKLAPVNVIEHAEHPVRDENLRALVTHRVSGPYPAADPGVLHFHHKKSAEQNRAWYVNGQDVIFIAEGLASGRYPTARVFAVSGTVTENNRHVRSRLGVPVKLLMPKADRQKSCRWIAGGIFNGYDAPPGTYMGLHETALTLLPEATEPEFLGFARPGWNKPTCSKTFLSALRKEPLITDTGMHGEHRACVNCGYCMRVCPVAIWPNYTYKSLYADEIEEALAHGLLDCVECGLCSYVCPSKVELMQTFQNTRHAFYRDRI